jgi:hypothetical protein
MSGGLYEVYRRSELALPDLPQVVSILIVTFSTLADPSQLKTRRLWDTVFTHSALPNGNRVLAALGYRIIATCVTEWLIDADPALTNSELAVRTD